MAVFLSAVKLKKKTKNRNYYRNQARKSVSDFLWLCLRVCEKCIILRSILARLEVMIVGTVSESLALAYAFREMGIEPGKFKKDYDRPELRNEERCRSCRGLCCLTCGCLLSPDDFTKWFGVPPTSDLVERELKKGYLSIVAIDYGSDSIFGMLLRMRRYGEQVVIMDDSPDIVAGRFGPCVAWRKESGCMFDWEQRPAGGKLLKPGSTPLECVCDYPVESAAGEWLMFPDLLTDLANNYRGSKISEPKTGWTPLS